MYLLKFRRFITFETSKLQIVSVRSGKAFLGENNHILQIHIAKTIFTLKRNLIPITL